jgi:hypothetical protein
MLYADDSVPMQLRVVPCVVGDSVPSVRRWKTFARTSILLPGARILGNNCRNEAESRPGWTALGGKLLPKCSQSSRPRNYPPILGSKSPMGPFWRRGGMKPLRNGHTPIHMHAQILKLQQSTRPGAWAQAMPAIRPLIRLRTKTPPCRAHVPIMSWLTVSPCKS